MTDKLTALSDPEVLQAERPLWCLPLEAPSPTHIDILGFTEQDRQIKVLSKEFVLDKALLKHDYLKPENTDRKNHFLNNIMNKKGII